MIDLHTHTNYSDGTWNLIELLKEAEKTGIEVLSITDHDTIEVYNELENIKYNEIFKGVILPGIEFNTVYDGVAFHLLAYNFDYKKLNNWIYKKYTKNKPNLKKEFEFMLNSCKKNNIKIGKLDYNENKDWPIDIIFSEIKKYDENKKYFKETEWNDIDVFFNSCITNKNFPVFVDFSIHYPNAKEVSEIVRKAGGKLFIAHAFKYNLDNTINFINILNNDNIIDGIEVYHSSFNLEQTNILKKYCKDNKLLMSGGSDCHGDKKKNRKIGIGYGEMNISKNILNDWKL